MKKFMVIAAMAAVALVSCNKEGFSTDDEKKKDQTKVEGIVFNEIDAQNKFIELYNTTDKDVTISGIYIVKYDSSKEGGKSTTWTAADGLKIAAKGFLYVESSDLADENEGGDPSYQYQDANGTYVFKGGLSPKKNVKLELYGSDEKLLDSFIRGEEGAGWNQVKGYPESKTDSFSRVPDGTGDFVYAAPTKGASNGAKTGDIVQTNA